MSIPSLGRIQDEAHAWRERNFPDTYTPVHQVLGVCEESGELAHAILKLEQGIRGTAEEHNKAAQDACGDIIIFLTGVASAMGFRLDEALYNAWTEVKFRNWQANKHDGSGGVVPVEVGGVDVIQGPPPTALGPEGERKLAERQLNYVCPQCGPDPEGPEAHAEKHHTWPPVDPTTMPPEGHYFPGSSPTDPRPIEGEHAEKYDPHPFD